jgi:hypothetical protein
MADMANELANERQWSEHLLREKLPVLILKLLHQRSEPRPGHGQEHVQSLNTSNHL